MHSIVPAKQRRQGRPTSTQKTPTAPSPSVSSQSNQASSPCESSCIIGQRENKEGEKGWWSEYPLFPLQSFPNGPRSAPPPRRTQSGRGRDDGRASTPLRRLPANSGRVVPRADGACILPESRVPSRTVQPCHSINDHLR